MDATTRGLCDYVVGLSYDDLSQSAIHAAKRLMLDSLGCAVAAYDSDVARIIWKMAPRNSGSPSAVVLGCSHKASPEYASFANTALIRHLDWNDAPASAQHPSDNFGHIISIADAFKQTGKSLILAAIISYEIQSAISPGMEQRSRAWDDGPLVAIAAACSTGKMLGLTPEQLGHAIAISTVSNIALRATKMGTLSMWKGCGTAHAAQNGVLAALLARQGITGPSDPFDGRLGFWEVIADPCDPDSLATRGKKFAIEMSTMKFFPACDAGQSAMWAARELYPDVKVHEISEIRVDTYLRSFLNMASDPTKWDPQSHETADHSLPFVIAAVLARGVVSPADYTAEGLQDTEVRALMPLVKVLPNEEMTNAFPRSLPARVEVITTAGKRHIAEVINRKGHYSNPMSDDEVYDKFRMATSQRLDQKECAEAITRIMSFDEAGSLDDVLALLVPLDA